MEAGPHAPLDAASLGRAIRALESGVPYRTAFEALLLELDDDAAERTMQLQREARGAWLLLLRVPPAGQRAARALLIGNALSGASLPLAQSGFEVTLCDRSALRLRFAELRNAALAPRAATRTLLGDGAARLPFDDGAFELVVQEDGAPCARNGWGHALDELRRLASSEVLLVADNRFAYKRSSGRHGVFEVPTPLHYLRRLLAASGERSLAGYRAACSAAGFAPPRAFALYPHAQEFTFVVGLDTPLPRLELGPQERRNRLKVAAHALGLFPVFAPSFAVLTARRASALSAPRVERLLAELARLTGEPRPELEHLVATRGNSALLLTRHGPGPRAADAGWWCVHVGLNSAQRRQLGDHFRFLGELRARHPSVPVPEPLYAGEVDGLFLTCERRVAGLTAPQLTGRLAATRRTVADLARLLAGLVSVPATALTEEEFERLIARRFELVGRHVTDPATAAELGRMHTRARELLIGRVVPLVVQHSDLRSKHVQVTPDGRVLALLDWGSAEVRDLPYFDLLHFVIHERKQSGAMTAERAWRLVLAREGLRDWEASALDDYARRVGLDDASRRAIEGLYPVLVAAMAEAHWDFSRPHWFQRQFGLGGASTARER